MTLICSPLPEFDRSGGRVKETSGYRTPERPEHFGSDYGTTDGIEIGTPLHAVEDGVIVFIQPASAGAGAGHYIHLKGDSGRGWRYLHLREGGTRVKVGDRVKMGQQIAEVGNTGGVAAHLHLEEILNPNGNWFDGRNNTTNPHPDVQAAWNAGRWPGTAGGGSPSTPPEDDVTPQDIDAIADKVIKRLGDKDDQGANKAREEIAFSSWFAVSGQGEAQSKPGDRLNQPFATVDDANNADLILSTYQGVCQLVADAVGKTLTWDQGAPKLQ